MKKWRKEFCASLLLGNKEWTTKRQTLLAFITLKAKRTTKLFVAVVYTGLKEKLVAKYSK